MFEKKVWNDRQSEHPARRRLTPTENDNEYEVSRAEGLVMEEGDAFDCHHDERSGKTVWRKPLQNMILRNSVLSM